MEFLEIKLFDDDFFKMIFRFFINIVFLTIIIRFQYFTKTRRKDYLFTYYMIGIIVFFLSFTLKKFQLDLGMALGLFAVFGIIRYRTDTIEIREMTFLFVVIGLSIINALANKKLSYSEILGLNTITVVSIWIIDRFTHLKTELSKKILYENIENIKPVNQEILLEDLRQKTGINIHRVEVGDIDFLRDVSKLTVYYYENQNYEK
jgi:multidrug transporter EmrE-like cation transporter